MKPIAHEKRDLPATEEQGSHQAGYDNRLNKVYEHEDSLLRPRILGVVSGNQFGLCFGQIKRYPLALGNPRRQEDEERNWLVENSPAGNPTTDEMSLSAGDFLQIERTEGQNDADQRKAHSDL